MTAHHLHLDMQIQDSCASINDSQCLLSLPATAKAFKAPELIEVDGLFCSHQTRVQPDIPAQNRKLLRVMNIDESGELSDRSAHLLQIKRGGAIKLRSVFEWRIE